MKFNEIDVIVFICLVIELYETDLKVVQKVIEFPIQMPFMIYDDDNDGLGNFSNLKSAFYADNKLGEITLFSQGGHAVRAVRAGNRAAKCSIFYELLHMVHIGSYFTSTPYFQIEWGRFLWEKEPG